MRQLVADGDLGLGKLYRHTDECEQTKEHLTTLPLTDLDHEQDTRAAADGYALTMGQQWVDNHT
jgi:hypothetical protein